MGIDEFNGRQNTIVRAGASIKNHAQARLQSQANNLSRKGLIAAACEHINSAVQEFIGLLYVVDTTGYPANLDMVSYKVLIPSPWSCRHYATYGLRSTESELLRRHMLLLSSTPNRLLYYDKSTRKWYVNSMYQSLKDASNYWKSHQIEPEQYLKHQQRMKKRTQ